MYVRQGICLFLCLLSLCGCAEGAEYIRVGTFNIARFGAGDEYERSLISLVNILRELDADLVCLQEIQPHKQGYEQMERLVKLLNKAAAFDEKPPYSFVVSRKYRGPETTAFLWRDPVRLLSEIDLIDIPEDPDNDGLPTFQRTPSIGLFQAGDYDFYVVNVHLYTQTRGKSSEGRGDETEALAEWLARLPRGKERDALIAGDFNRFLNGKNDWREFMAPGHDRYYRVPLLEAIQNAVPSFDPVDDEAPSEQFSTTTSRKPSIYDLIVISAGSYREFVPNPVFGRDVGIVQFDRHPHYEWFIHDWQDATNILSDHRPVWIRLRIDLGDDD